MLDVVAPLHLSFSVQSRRARNTYQPGERGIVIYRTSVWGRGGAMARCGGGDKGRCVVDDRWLNCVSFRNLGRKFFPSSRFAGKHQTTTFHSRGIEYKHQRNQLTTLRFLCE
jgi:hypothetical protein